MVKIIYMAKETFSSIKALEYLCGRKDEIAVLGTIIHSEAFKLQKLCEENGLNVFTEEQLKENYLKGELEADYIFSFYWKKIGKDILGIPKKGSINFHPGPLPEARGSGYHMAILENWGYWGVTVHYMDSKFDEGSIIECRRFQIKESILNQDLVKMSHEHLAVLFEDTVEHILRNGMPEGIKQEEGRYFSLKKLEEGKLIKCGEDTDTIEKKIRAYWNPPYSGAQIEIQGKRYTVIDETILNWIAEKIDT